MSYSFKTFLAEEEKRVYFTFGRMNPPTIGHGKLLEKLATMAGKNQYRVYLPQSQDKKEQGKISKDLANKNIIISEDIKLKEKENGGKYNASKKFAIEP